MVWAPDYVTASELKTYVNIGDAVDDAQVADAITAASRAIDHETGRQFGLVASVEERFYSARWDRTRCRWVIEIDDLMTVTGLVVESDSVAVTAYTLGPRNAVAKGRPWIRLLVDPESAVMPTGVEDEISVTASWGWTAVPTSIKAATKLQASRFLKRRDAPFGVAGSPEMGSEIRLLAKVDPDVAVALGPYVRHWAVR